MSSQNMPLAGSTPAADQPAPKPSRLRKFLVANWVMLAYFLAAAIMISAVLVLFSMTIANGEEALQTSLSLSTDELRDLEMEELEEMRDRIHFLVDGDSGSPAVIERELDRVDAAILEIIDAR